MLSKEPKRDSFEPVPPRPVRSPTQPPVPPAPSLKPPPPPKLKPAQSPSTSATGGQRSASDKLARAGDGFLGRLVLLGFVGTIVVLLLWGGMQAGSVLVDGGARAYGWISDQFTAPDRRAWRVAQGGDFAAVERFLQTYPDSSHADAARGSLIRLAETLPGSAAPQTLRVKFRARLRGAPSLLAPEVAILPRGTAVYPLTAVRAAAWYRVTWRKKKVYVAARLLRPEPVRPRAVRRRRSGTTAASHRPAAAATVAAPVDPVPVMSSLPSSAIDDLDRSHPGTVP